MYELPTALEVNGIEYGIRSDYRVALDICATLSDPSLKNWERAAALLVLYEDAGTIPRDDLEESLKQSSWFLSCGDGLSNKPTPKLMDWEKDFKWIVAPINRVAGAEIRAVQYMHWWTFISYYYEIGDCMFAQIVNIRNKKRKGKKLEKHEREFYNANRDAIDLGPQMTDADRDVLKTFLGGG